MLTKFYPKDDVENNPVSEGTENHLTNEGWGKSGSKAPIIIDAWPNQSSSILLLAMDETHQLDIPNRT
jgi:hypothetical protein